MAATYGYGGEFSSDEDIDKLEQQSERTNQSNNHAQLKPNRHQIDEAILAIRQMPIDKDVNIPDDLLAALLDHYKTQRGPIVDSTRGLYKKIILRLIRGEQLSGSNGDSTKDNNGNNNNNNNVLDKKQRTEAASSDEDEPMPSAADLNKVKRFDSRVVYNNNNHTDGQVEPMEVDSEPPTSANNRPNLAGRRLEKDETEESSDADSEESTSESDTSDSEVLDVTPVKTAPQPSQQQAQKAKPAPASQSSVAKKVTVAASSKDSQDPKKKPYTRSQRVATRSATSASTVRNITQLDVSSSKSEVVASSGRDSVFNTSTQRRSRMGAKIVMAAFVVLVLAFVVYHFRTDLTKSAQTLLSKSGVKL